MAEPPADRIVVDIRDLARGRMRVVELAGRAVLLCNVNGVFYAVRNRCTHARAPLADGRLSGYEIECPLHGARFDVRDGRAIALPARRALDTYSVTLRDGSAEIRASDAPAKDPARC